MISIDGRGRLINLDLARDRNNVYSCMSVRTVSCNVQRAFELHTNKPPHITGHMAIYVDSAAAQAQKSP